MDLIRTLINYIYASKIIIYDPQFLTIMYNRSLENVNKKLRCCSVKPVNHDEQF